MENCYINGVGSVNIQALGFNVMTDIPTPLRARNEAVHPSYKGLIAGSMLRRMASDVRMGLFAALRAMEEAGVSDLDAIIAGTGLGCLQESEKFLKAMIDNNEEYLTPTSFIQSTHNTVAAQIALHLQCKAYNFTYVNGVNSFEAALWDGLQQIRVLAAREVLVGGIDETAPAFDALFELAGDYKALADTIDFKDPKNSGVCRAEGANFFVLSKDRRDSSYAKLLDVSYFNRPRIDLQSEIDGFLGRNDLCREDMDVLFLGINADLDQQAYFSAYVDFFPATAQAYYQHISGSFDTASAYGLYLAAMVLREQTLPRNICYNDIKPRRLKNILLINQSQGLDNSLVLLQVC